MDTVGDEIDGGLVARDHQQESHRGDFLLGEPVAVVAGGDERGQEVVARPGPFPRDQRAQPVQDRLRRGDGHLAVALAPGLRVPPDLEDTGLVRLRAEQVEEDRQG
ncbi:cytochrome P-450 hydroxylase [Streptomyces laurentii]|uniref:Cytochrome P-450 hydroxylase n=1 Tax=Streptomyces laurentii TaxID=39478 RepID=A0A169P1B9_STRLU|nr:cytochrome P-450 hydroxylase [Streptomyces laurentii]